MKSVCRNRGVTLVELLMVIVIIAILSSIAVPTYRSYVLRAQRTEATATLLRVQAAQEKFFAQNNIYAADLAAAPPAGLRSEGGITGGRIGLPDSCQSTG
jgi:type IV pilus assembly protein PilE